MIKMRAKLRLAWVYVRKNWFVFFATTVYLLFTVYYMGPGLLNCTSTVNGFGDSTGGPIWKYSLDSSSPLTSYGKYTNYPFGESMASPVDAAVIGQTVLIWLASSAAGPVCGYNIVNAVGFMLTALIMFGFIYSLTRRRWIALLAGYAFAFTPYLQVKVGVHPGYGYGALLIGVLWAFLSLIQTRKISRAFLLTGLLAICFYFDPYFSLLAASLLVPLGLVYGVRHLLKWKGYGRVARETVTKQVKLLLLSVAGVLILIAPLFIIMATQWDKISSSLSGTRDNISEVATLCSNWPHEYLLPFPDSRLLKLFGSSEQIARESLYSFSTCGIAEDSVGIGLVILLIVLIGSLIFLWEKFNNRSLGLRGVLKYDPYLVIPGLLAVSLFALTLAFPPVYVFGVPSPAQVLISLTSTWRILSREYMVLNLSMIVIFSVFLTYFYYRFKSHKKLLLCAFIVIFGLLFVQYQTYRPFAGNEPTRFNYTQIPTAYTWLKSQNNIKAVAEYPIELVTESNSLGYYLTMQSVHKKPLFNSALANSQQNQLRSSMKNLNDPQTVKVLASVGIDAVIIHGVNAHDVEAIPYLAVVYVGNHSPARLPESQSVKSDTLVIAKIENAPQITKSLQFVDNLPYNSVIHSSVTQWQYEVPNGSRFIMDNTVSSNRDGDDLNKVCFNIKMAATGDVGLVTLSEDYENGRILYQDEITDDFQRVKTTVPSYRKINIKNDKGYNMRITGIGCRENE